MTETHLERLARVRHQAWNKEWAALNAQLGITEELLEWEDLGPAAREATLRCERAVLEALIKLEGLSDESKRRIKSEIME